MAEGIAHLMFNPDSRWKWVVSFTHRSLFFIGERAKSKRWVRAVMGKLRPAGQMRPT